MDDYKKFCMKCGWNDPDFGCMSPPHEEVYQCDMYRYYHPEEVKEFENQMKDWIERRKNIGKQEKICT